MRYPPVLGTGVLFPWRGEGPDFPTEWSRVVCVSRYFPVTGWGGLGFAVLEALGYAVGSSWGAFLGMRVLTGTRVRLLGGDAGSWFSVFRSSQFVTRGSQFVAGPEAVCYLASTLRFTGLSFERCFPSRRLPCSLPSGFWAGSAFLTLLFVQHLAQKDSVLRWCLRALLLDK